MKRLPMSSAATGLLRALIARAEIPRDRILLIDWESNDWQSLTFLGERHLARLRVCGPDARVAVTRLTSNLLDAEFEIRGNIVADIAVVGQPERADDGSIILSLEALTVAE